MIFRTWMGDPMGRFIGIASASIFLLGAFLLAGSIIRAQDSNQEPQKSSPLVVDGRVPTATPWGTPGGNGVDLADAVGLLRSQPALRVLIDAIEQRDANGLVKLLTQTNVACGSRNAALKCAEGQIAVPAVTFDDASSQSNISVEAAVELFGRLLAAEPRLALVTRYQSARGDSADYLIAFTISPFTLGDSSRSALVPGDMEFTGFGLRIASSAAAPILNYSLLTTTWQPLEWAQVYEVEDQVLVAPKSLDGLTRIDD